MPTAPANLQAVQRMHHPCLIQQERLWHFTIFINPVSFPKSRPPKLHIMKFPRVLLSLVAIQMIALSVSFYSHINIRKISKLNDHTFPIISSCLLETKPKIYIHTVECIYLLSNQRWWHITHPKSAKAIIFPSSTSTHCTNIWSSLILWRTDTFLNSSYTHEIPMWPPTLIRTMPSPTIYTCRAHKHNINNALTKT